MPYEAAQSRLLVAEVSYSKGNDIRRLKMDTACSTFERLDAVADIEQVKNLHLS